MGLRNQRNLTRTIFENRHEEKLFWLEEENRILRDELLRTKDSKQRYQILAEYSSDVIFQFKRSLIRKGKLQCIYVSPIIEEFCGFTVSETLSQKPIQFLHPDDQESVDEAFRQVIDREKNEVRIRYRRKRKDNNYMWVESVGKLRQANGSETLIVNMRNISAQVKIEQEYGLSEKMASLGRLTAGIAHEIKNPLNYIQGSKEALTTNLEDLKERVLLLMGEGPQDVKDTLHQEVEKLFIYLNKSTKSLENGIEKIKDLTDGLKIYTRSKTDEHIPGNITDIIQATLTVLASRYKSCAELSLKFNSIPLVPCNPGKLGQVFDNLISNASYAIEKKYDGNKNGEIIIQADYLSDEQKVRISVSDNGPGIKKEDIDKIFEPFFTTKAVGEGTGLGLAICYSIIKEHKGTLHTVREELEGINGREMFTSFIVTLPADQLDT